jgi:crotonobetainyl-CoA:carnitine CoA-transferase CaiB-like acyl-CoA transferase
MGCRLRRTSGRRSSDADVLVECATRARCASLARASAIAALADAGVRAVPVTRVHEFIADGDFLADVLSVARDANGTYWPVLKMPYRLSATPARICTVPDESRSPMVSAACVSLT